MAIDTAFVENNHLNIFEVGLAYVKNFQRPETRIFEIRPPKDHHYCVTFGGRTINSRDYENKLEFEKVWNFILKHAKYCDFFCAHNVQTDRNKLAKLAEYYGLEPLDIRWVDTKLITKNVLGEEWNSHKLETAIKKLGIDVPPKRGTEPGERSASDRDADACAQIVNFAVETTGLSWLIDFGVDISPEKKNDPGKLDAVSRGIWFVDAVIDELYLYAEDDYDKLNNIFRECGANIYINDGIDAQERREIANNWLALLKATIKYMDEDFIRFLVSDTLGIPVRLGSKKYASLHIANYIRGGDANLTSEIFNSLEPEEITNLAYKGAKLLLEAANFKRQYYLELADNSGASLPNRQRIADIVDALALHYSRNPDCFCFNGGTEYLDDFLDILEIYCSRTSGQAAKSKLLYEELVARVVE